MKVTYIDRVERHRAWSNKMTCPVCSGHIYEVVEQVEPKEDLPVWYVRCPYCGTEGLAAPARDIAIARWKQLFL